ncbi:MAG: phosphoadenylyl-sulfate reductase [Acidimicrobiia bacterium]|nr:phosphoadenylyl-sulfate reductase [Acidimicrobiia bacterium]
MPHTAQALTQLVEDPITIEDIPRLNEELDGLEAHEIIKFAHALFGDGLTMACSFQDMVMLDIVAKVAPGMRVFTLDTGYLFHETEEAIRRARARYPELRIDVYRPAHTLDAQEREHGHRLYAHDNALCCEINKIEPMRRALDGYTAWMTGIRRSQSASRSTAQPVSWDVRWNIAKFAPMVDWSDDDIATYTAIHDVPYNRLLDRGYPSVGCAPCTAVPTDGDRRSGRWAGTGKTECGIHVASPDAVGVPGRVERVD